MLAHQIGGGCPLRTGNFTATGTLSGPITIECVYLLEATPDELHRTEVSNAQDQCFSRTFLEDGDSVKFTAHLRAEAN
jgi:hypothetical protein